MQHWQTQEFQLRTEGLQKGFRSLQLTAKNDEEAQIDYTLLTDESMTCVFLMGLAHVEHIAEELIRAGRRPDTPAAVISNGTLAAQKKCIGTLESIGYKVKLCKTGISGNHRCGECCFIE